MPDTQQIEIKQGFKKTKLGWIPEDWEVKRFEEISIIKVGKDLNESIYSGKKTKKFCYPVFSNSVQATGLYGYYSKYEFDEKAVTIVGRGAGLGMSFIRERKFAAIGRLLILFPKTQNDYKYISYFINFKVNFFIESSGIPQLTGKQLALYKICLPYYTEQKAIANCLSTWDTAITSLDQLITAKQQLKKALMQQLLSGKKRLPGFEGEWQEKRVEDVAKEYSQKNDKNDEIEVLSCTKYDGLVPSLEYFGRQVFGDDLSKYKVVPKGYFAYATNHIEEGSIGYQNFNKLGLVSPMYTVFKTDERINDGYLFKVLKSHKLIHEYNRRMEGSIDRRGGLRWKNFRRIKLLIPSYDEQTAIALVLNTADQEIKLLTTQREQLQTQKKGLMQQLLTGKKRLGIN